MIAAVRLIGLILMQSAKLLQLGAVLYIALRGGRTRAVYAG